MDDFESSAFGSTEAEAKARWGGIDAYKEYEERIKNRSAQARDDAATGLERIMAAFAACKKDGNAVACAEAQTLVRELQSYITAQYYTCTDQILAGLGQTYAEDERFRQNIDKYGAGTAAFIRDAIEAFCEK